MDRMMQLNGRAVSAEDLASLALYNYGSFTSMRVENGTVRGLSLHLERLRSDTKTLFDANLDLDFVLDMIRLAVPDISETRILRVTVFDPGLDLGHPGVSAAPQVLVTTRPANGRPLKPLRLATARYSRDLPAVKHVGIFETIRSRRAAQLAGYDDVLFVEDDSSVSEGATWNIGFSDGSQIIWPKAEVLPGVTMRLIECALPESGIRSISVPVSVEDLSEISVAFATNVSIGVRPIASINEHPFSTNSQILTRLANILDEIPGESL